MDNENIIELKVTDNQMRVLMEAKGIDETVEQFVLRSAVEYAEYIQSMNWHYLNEQKTYGS
jgi:uncharacterized protein (DUF1778 family)